jgi:hypothetical protein
MIRTSLLVALLLAALPVQHAAAQTYKFKKIAYDKKDNTTGHAIGKDGTFVGGYYQSGTTVRNCFTLKGKTKTTLSDPDGALGTECWDINSAGTVVGDYVDSSGIYHGYTYSKGTYTTFDPPGSTYTVGYGINDSNFVVGFYVDAAGNQYGYTYDGKKYTTIKVKGGNTVLAFGVNASGQITVEATLSDGFTHSWVYTGKKKKELVFPNIQQVAGHHLNTAGQVSATIIDSSSNYFGGVYDPVKDAYYQFSYPKAALTIMDGINDSETLAGRYAITSSGTSYGYIGTGKLP